MRDWRRQKSKLGSLPSKSQRLPGGGRKPHAEDMEEVLAAWIEQQRGRHLRVTRTAIQRKAIELYDGMASSLLVGVG